MQISHLCKIKKKKKNLNKNVFASPPHFPYLLNDPRIKIKSIRTDYSCVLYFNEVSSNSHNEGARGVMVIVVGNGHGDTCLNPGRY